MAAGARAAAPVPPPAPLGQGILPNPTSSLQPSVVDGVQFTPTGKSNFRFSYNQNGLALVGKIGLDLEPRVQGAIRIAGGKLVDSYISVTGLAAFGLDLQGRSEHAAQSQLRRERIELPTILRVDLGHGFSLQLSQTFLITTAFESDGYLALSAKWSLSGATGFGLRNGSIGAFKPSVTSAATTLADVLNNAQSTSVAPVGVLLGYKSRLTFGFGIAAFSVGLFAELSFTFGFAASSLFSIEPFCRSVALNLGLNVGATWSIPDIIATVINGVLSLFGAHPVPSHGDLPITSISLLSSTEPAQVGTNCTPPHA